MLSFHRTNAFTSPSDLPLIPSKGTPFGDNGPKTPINADQLRQEWIDRSVDYYSKVMREERRRNMGQIGQGEFLSEDYQ
jgi:hypothetical protein